MPAGSLSYAEAEFLAGWLALEYKNLPSVAYNHFVNIIQNVSTPISLARGTYWAGIAARRTGDLATANAMLAKASSYPVTFYGQLAALESNTPVRLNASGVRNRQSQKAFESDERVHAVRHLVQLGELRRIDSFIRTLGQHDNEDFIVMAAELAHSLKRYDLSVAIAKQAKAGGVVLPDIEFPLIELPTMARAPEAGLIYAVIRQESVFNPSARSHAGALGMMQLMPATARLEAKLMNLPFSNDKLIRDADYNIKMGSHHLSRLVQSFNGSYPLAIAAYNAGSTNVHRWLRDYGDPRTKSISYINWMESIPFRETRNYVHRVLEGLEVYRLRLESNPSHKIPLTEAYAWCSVSCPIVQEELKRANLAQAQ
jgi:soluble lytic murein transglycosylase